MAEKLSTIAKVIARNDPEAYRKAKDLCEPMLKQTKLVPRIYQAIEEQYPELDRTDKSILFAASVYSAFAPATLLGQGMERAPNGIRKPMCEVMQWKDEPTVNYYQDLSRAYIKGAKFKERVSSILLGFQQFSVKSQQIEMF